jgi:hypothetical protein
MVCGDAITMLLNLRSDPRIPKFGSKDFVLPGWMKMLWCLFMKFAFGTRSSIRSFRLRLLPILIDPGDGLKAWFFTPLYCRFINVKLADLSDFLVL